jgi:hypothetical protein
VKNPNEPVALGLRLYRALAQAFPQEFKNAYGDELMQVTEEAIGASGGATASLACSPYY